jgi:hypothetical protein
MIAPGLETHPAQKIFSFRQQLPMLGQNFGSRVNERAAAHCSNRH